MNDRRTPPDPAATDQVSARTEFGWLAALAAPYRGRLAVAFVSMLLTGAAGLVVPRFAGQAVDAVLVERSVAGLRLWILTLVGLYVVVAVLDYLEAYLLRSTAARVLRDLRQRGMLDDTLVLFTSEFGRTPFTQSGADSVGTGRDHNQTGFSVWLAGAGLRGGMAFGATDDIGWRAVEKPVAWHDFHATVLHLLGIDHERLTYYHNGIQRRLTNVHGAPIREILRTT